MLCERLFKSPWIVVSACFILQIYSVGSEYAFGLLNIKILEEFDLSTSEVAWIGSIQMAVFFFTGLLVIPFKALLGWTRINIIGCVLITAGIVSTYYCTIPHLLYLTYGLLVGSGTGIHYFMSTVRIQEVFGDNRALANGIASSGGGVGVILLSIIRESAFNKYGWREGLLLELVFIPLCLLCIGMLYTYERTAQDDDTIALINVDKVPHPSYGIQFNSIHNERNTEARSMKTDQDIHDDIQSNDTQVSRRSESYKKFLSDPILYLTLAVALLITNGLFAPSTYLPLRSEHDLGMNSKKSADQVFWMGVVSIPARIISGYVGTHGLEARFLFFVLVNLVSGVMTSLVFLYTTYTLLMVYAVVIGLLSGTYATLWPVLIVDIFGKEDLDIPMSFYLSAMAVSLLIGYPFLGRLAEISENYVNTFIAMGVLEIAAVFLCVILALVSHRRLKHSGI